MDPRGDGPFHVLERINDNAYKIDLPGEYNLSSTFNVADLSLFDFLESRTNLFEEGGMIRVTEAQLKLKNVMGSNFHKAQ